MGDEPAAGAGPDPDGGHDSHGERHELLIASLLDRDLADDGDRLVAEALVRRCSDCAALHADLVMLSAATRELPATARPRDFRLTAADAAHLVPVGAGAGEPRGAASRLAGEMHLSNADHETHDRLLIASLLDRSTGGADRERAEELVGACNDCALLHQDLLSLREATRALPTPPRPREFTLSTVDAARLRRTGWRRLVAAFGSTRDAFSRPLAIGLTTLGLVGLLAASIPGVLSVGAGSTAGVPTIGQAVGGAGANPESLGESRAAPAPSAAPSAAPPFGAAQLAPSAEPTTATAPAAASPAAQPSGEAFDTSVGSPAASAGAAAIAPNSNDSAQRQGVESKDVASTSLTASSVDRVGVLVLACLLLVVGMGLFALRWAGRRV